MRRFLSLPLILCTAIGVIDGSREAVIATQTAPKAKPEAVKSDSKKPDSKQSDPQKSDSQPASATGKVTAEPSSNLPWMIGGGAAVLSTLGGAIALYRLGRQSGQTEAQVDHAVRQYRALADLEPAAPSPLEESLYGLKSASVDQSSLDEFARDLQEFAGAQLEQTPATITSLDDKPLDGTEFDGIQWDMAQIDAAFADVDFPEGDGATAAIGNPNKSTIEPIVESVIESPIVADMVEPAVVEPAVVEPATAVTVVVTASPVTSPPSPSITRPNTSQLATGRATTITPSPVTAEVITPQTMRPGLANRSARLPQVGVVEGLLKEIQNPDPAKRRKAIWELGQWGDTRAVQPLVDMMLEADSKQRSLILSSLTEIGSRTLKPMSKALAISLQDDSPDVRRNAIRDLTRLYDLVSQISQMVQKTAIDDPDDEVRDTANWALKQLNRIRPPVMDENLIAIASTVTPPERLSAAE